MMSPSLPLTFGVRRALPAGGYYYLRESCYRGRIGAHRSLVSVGMTSHSDRGAPLIIMESVRQGRRAPR
jgi:hypothetical protein